MPNRNAFGEGPQTLSGIAGANLAGRGLSRLRLCFLAMGLALLSACTSTGGPGVIGSQPGVKPHYKVGNPYQIQGLWYYPAVDEQYREIGVASWYGPNFNGKPTANGELFDKNALTAAHRTLPMPSIVEVHNLDNGRKVIVRVNDRGPFAKDRIIDLSEAAATKLGFRNRGTANVDVRFIRPANLELALVRLNDRRGISAMEAELSRSRRSSRRSRQGGASDIASSAQNSGRTQAANPAQNIEELLARQGLSNSRAPIPSRGPQQPVPPNRPFTGGQPATLPQRANASPTGIARPPATERYEIQVGAYKDINRAQLVRQRLQQSGPVFTQSVNLPSGGSLYRVYMGPYNRAADAQQTLNALQNAGYRDAWIRAVTSW